MLVQSSDFFGAKTYCSRMYEAVPESGCFSTLVFRRVGIYHKIQPVGLKKKSTRLDKTDSVDAISPSRVEKKIKFNSTSP